MTEQITAPRRETLHLGLVLGGIAFFVALMLSVANSVTAPIIEQNTKEQETIAFSALFPDATDFKEASPGEPGLTPSASTAYQDGVLLGVVVTATPRGYGGEMELLIGFDTGLRVTGIQFISTSESPGIGTKVQEESYWGQYIGQSEFDGVDAVTGATVSSKAVKSGVTAASELAMAILAQEVQ